MATFASLRTKQHQHATAILNFTTNTRKTAKDKRTAGYLRGRINIINDYWSKFVELHEEISEVAGDKLLTEPYFKNDEFSIIEIAYGEALGVLNDDLDAFDPKIVGPSPFDDGANTSASMQAQPARQQTSLPRIEVPKFSGNYGEWQSFKDLFSAIIASNGSLPNVQKLHYLKSGLSGEASRLLSNTATTDANFDAAWALLRKHYENKRLLVNTHLQTLFQLQQMSKESAAELKEILYTTNQAITALRNLDRPVDTWDDWLVYNIVQKLDKTSRRDWETKIADDTEVVTFEQLSTFLSARIRALEAIDTSKLSSQAPLKSKSTINMHHSSNQQQHHSSKSSGKCHHCHKDHFLSCCSKFRKKNIDERRQFVKKEGLCFNCLRDGHSVANCPSEYSCKRCNKRHHTVVHTAASQQDEVESPVSSFCSNMTKNRGGYRILLATAIVKVRCINGDLVPLRALLDQGSQSSFVTEEAAQRLKLYRFKTNVAISGIAATNGTIAYSRVQLSFSPHHNCEKIFRIEALVLNRLTYLLPENQFETRHWPHLEKLTLADPDFSRPGKIDIILGADIYGALLCDGLKPSIDGSPIGQNTELGWILSGTLHASVDFGTISSFHTITSTDEQLNQSLIRFWELESIADQVYLTEEESACENHYAATHRRDHTGRYIVRLPLRPQFQNDIGESRNASIKRLYSMERKFIINSELKTRYVDFMTDYRRLHHMELVTDDSRHKLVNYLPHHAVVKETSSTTKLRVVFDASHKTSSGFSLNDMLYTGPKLQQELFVVILRWRLYAVVFTTDIEKMFRQILVDERDVDLQRIVWRSSVDSQVENYRLMTVTYGTACAPFLALRTLKQLAHDEIDQFPTASQCLTEHCYVDDILAGSNDVDSCIQLQHQLVKLLHRGGFNLKKWSSNRAEVLCDLPADAIENNAFVIEDKTSITALGIRWYPTIDTFGFNISLGKCLLPLTKRFILSEVSKLFDPLGWLAPVVICGKIIMQKLWLSGAGWDEPIINSPISDDFLNYRNGLATISQVSMPRWLGTNGKEKSIELHGFSDASIKAYSAAVYMRLVCEDGSIQAHLLAAKTKVAPVKQVSLPRLELCGAHLLASLLLKIKSSLVIPQVPTFAWSDSTVVIAWVSGAPCNWQVFIGNRVAKIQEVLNPSDWHHVPTEDNPADCASRGISPAEIQNHPLWWHGPTWLTHNPDQWPNTTIDRTTDLETRRTAVAASTFLSTMQFPGDVHQRYSSLNRLVRVMAYVKRFIMNSRANKILPVNCVMDKTLSTAEISSALTTCVKIVQHIHFHSEIISLATNKQLLDKSSLVRLRPMLDSDGILRVGGRLGNSALSYEEAHQIILPKKSEFTQLIIDNAHTKTLHGGAQLTLSHIRREYWVVDGRNQVRYFINRCLKCFRYNTRASEQLMGSLPAARVWPARPFLNSGIDYAGPIEVRPSRGRFKSSSKGYIAVFVCFTTRAVHLELVSDLTSQAFIAAYFRFTSRRGICANLYSDQGTTFIGANGELRTMLRTAIAENDEYIADELAKNGTQWHFNPPHAPHHGGLWEAAVKSTKHHLKRVIGTTKLTFEDMSTLLATIEACLNSRPIWAMSDDPLDFCALTPGHFLIGAPLRTIPQPSLANVKEYRLSQWKLLEKMRQDFWTRWSREYLNTLQQRCKWKSSKTPVKVGDLVLIKDDRLPPGFWSMARVVLCHPGKDGHTRVVTLRDATRTFQRPIVKICVLPVDTQTP